MFKPFLITTLLATSIAASAKSGADEFTIYRKDAVVGYTANKTPLHAVCYQFPKDVYQLSIDNEQNNALLLLKKVNEDNHFYGDGELSLLNFGTGDLDWHFTVKGTEVHRTRNVIFYQSKAGTYVFNVADKKRLPTTINNYLFLDYNSDIAYDGVSGVNLKTGKRVWKHATRNEDIPLDEFRRINDSMVAFSWAGMHVLNMNTGEGWDYKMKTSKGRAMSVFASIGVGIASGLLTPVAVVPVVRPQTGLKSNILFDDQQIYFADRENIVCWNIATGTVLWQNELPSEKARGSEIFMNGENIYLVNRAVFKGKDAGQPSIAAYNKNTGTKLFFEELGTTAISSLTVQNDSCLLYGSDVQKVDLRTGKHSVAKISGPTDSELKWLINSETIFIENGDNEITSLKTQFPGTFSMQAASGKIFVYNGDGTMARMLQPESYWSFETKYKGSRMLYRADHKVAFEYNGQKVMTLEPAIVNQIQGDNLYRIVDKGLQVISLSEIIPN